MIFYTISLKRPHNEVKVQPIDPYDSEKLFTGEWNPRGKLNFEKSQGRNFYDFIAYQDVFNILVSEKAANLILQNELTGVNFFPAEILGYNLKYLGIQILGRCGEIEREKSQGFHTGFSIDLASWDGSDFFTGTNVLYLICTERVKDILQSNEVSNLVFKQISQVKYWSSGR